MKRKTVTLLVSILVFFLSSNFANSEIVISIIDMETLLEKSKAGQSIKNQLEKRHKSNNEYFKKKEDEIKKKETKIIAQKNVISKEEYEKKIIELRKDIDLYRKDKIKKVNQLNNIKVVTIQKLLKEISPMLTQYSVDNNISIILDNKNIVVGKNELNITKDIIKILDKKITKVKIK
ncbi:MAG: OmpH family outer membrane protein [Flavobacteriaceae bacterium]|jgi:outer membrane protein|nr:OmpH family outer membrane protein [Flavobacteriaceae bacterium]